mgnify:CR=1 FL=1
MFFQAEDGIRYYKVTGVQTCALPILTEASMKLGEAVYKDMQQQQQEEPKKEEKKKDDNVVDADYEDVTPEVDKQD